MTRVIHKQALEVFRADSDELTIMLPVGAKVLRIARQYPREETPQIWYACDHPSTASEPVRILMVGTGRAFPVHVEPDYLGTEIFHNGQLVLHFFLLRGDR
jgi:hypothetical protein